MKRKAIKRWLAVVLSLTMAVSLVPAVVLTAGAEEVDLEDVTCEHKDYIIEGVTYYDTGVELDNEVVRSELYQALLSAPYRDGHSIAGDWQELAYYINRNFGGEDEDLGHKAAHDLVKSMLANHNGKGNELKYITKLEEFDDYEFRKSSSGLKPANSVAQAEYNMRLFCHNLYQNVKGTGNWWPQETSLKDNTTIQPTFYMVTFAGKQSGSIHAERGHGRGLGIIFSDFSIKPIFPERTDKPQKTGQSDYERVLGDIDQQNPSLLTGAQNDTTAVVVAEQELENAETVEVSTEFTKGKEFTWEEGIEVGKKWSGPWPLLGGGMHVNVHFNTSQAISQSWSEGKSNSTTNTTRSSISVTMPPYTKVLLESSKGVQEVTETFRSPMILNFKVTILDIALRLEDGASYTDITASFPDGNLVDEPGNARKSLDYRLDKQYIVRESKINWNTLEQFLQKDKEGELLQSLRTHAPISARPASVVSNLKVTSQKVSGLTALYPMTQVATTNQTSEYILHNGDSIFPESLGIEGQNQYQAPFYGFDASKGRWILTDKQGSDISTGSKVATLSQDPVTGSTKVTAGEQAGTVYLKYLIDEGYYQDLQKKAGMLQEAPITNDSIKPCIIPIHVTMSTSEGWQVRVSGEQKIIAGDPAVVPALPTDVYNKADRQVRYPVHWYAKNLDTVTVEADRFSAEKTLEPGAYTVGAYLGRDSYNPDAYAYHPIQVLEARKLAKLTIPEVQTFDRVRELDLNGLTVGRFDQYHNTEFDSTFNTNYTVSSVWDGKEPLTWTCHDQSVTVDETGQAVFPEKNGSYPFTVSAKNAKGETVTSNRLTVTIHGYVEGMDTQRDRIEGLDRRAVITLDGPNVRDGITVTAFDGDTITDITGKAQANAKADGQQQAVLTFPELPEGEPDKTYTIKCSYDGFNFLNTPATSVTVAATRIPGVPFMDVEPDDYYKEALRWAIADNITAGTTGMTFAPDGVCTRAQAASFLWRAAGSPAPSGKDLKVLDVPQESYCYDAVVWALENNIIAGTAEDRTEGEVFFMPDEVCTRAQIVTFLWRAKNCPSAAVSHAFEDVEEAMYYTDAVHWAAANHITTGTSTTTFSPEQECTRDQAVTFLYRDHKELGGSEG